MPSIHITRCEETRAHERVVGDFSRSAMPSYIFIMSALYRYSCFMIRRYICAAHGDDEVSCCHEEDERRAAGAMQTARGVDYRVRYAVLRRRSR